MNWKPEPEYQYVWHWITFREDGVREMFLIGVFDDMEQVRRYHEEQHLAPLLAQGVEIDNLWYPVGGQEFWISVLPSLIAKHDVNHHAVVRCKRNGGLAI